MGIMLLGWHLLGSKLACCRRMASPARCASASQFTVIDSRCGSVDRTAMSSNGNTHDAMADPAICAIARCRAIALLHEAAWLRAAGLTTKALKLTQRSMHSSHQAFETDMHACMHACIVMPVINRIAAGHSACMHMFVLLVRSVMSAASVRGGDVGSEEMVAQRSVQQYPMGGALRCVSVSVENKGTKCDQPNHFLSGRPGRSAAAWSNLNN